MASCQRAGLVHLSLGLEHGLVHVPILALLAGGDGDARGFLRALRQDRQFLEDDADLGIAFDQLDDVVQTALAVAAVVIEELDDGDVAVGIAGRSARRIAIDVRGVLGDGDLQLLRLLLLHLGFERGLHLEEDLRIGDEIVLDDLLELLLLLAREPGLGNGRWLRA